MANTFALAALAALALGCEGGAPSRGEEVPEILRHVTKVVHSVPDRHPYGDVSKLKVGQWARYREGDRTFTLAAVAKEGDDLWIEVIEEGEASARLVARDGTVKKALFRELSDDGPSEVVPQALEQAHPRAAKPPEGSRESGEEKVKAGDRELTAKRIRLRSEDAEGRIVEEVTWWHADVPPIYAGGPDGGLVRRASKGGSIELMGFGTDARPRVVPPPK